jgi:glycosyltransferase involved in cell wall biosynthesis
MDFIKFKEIYENIVVKSNNQVESKCKVSVCIQTYNHVYYIKECLESILSQKTNFDFEILLGEDNSSDGTRELCIDYAKRFPNKIRLFLHHRENNISIGGQPTGRFNFMYNLYSAKGKYIALCEGDDYWTDSLKLQKQVDFLEGNLEYSGIGTNSHFLDQETGAINLFKNSSKNKTLSIDDFIGSRHFHTASLMYRNEFDYNSNFTKVLSADRLLYLLLSLKGNIFYLNEAACVYRKNNGGISRKVTSSEMIKDTAFFGALKNNLTREQFVKLKKFIYKSILEYSISIRIKHYFYVAILFLLINDFNYSSRRIIKKSSKKISL